MPPVTVGGGGGWDVVERGVEGAVGVEAGDCEVGAAAIGEPSKQDLAVGLNGDGGGLVVEAEVDGLLAIRAEGRVESAVGVNTGDGEVVVGARCIGEPGKHDLPSA